MIQTLALIRWESPETFYILGTTFLAAYFIGSVPFGLIFAWIAGVGDVRKQGSGTFVSREGSL